MCYENSIRLNRSLCLVFFFGILNFSNMFPFQRITQSSVAPKRIYAQNFITRTKMLVKRDTGDSMDQLM